MQCDDAFEVVHYTIIIQQETPYELRISSLELSGAKFSLGFVVCAANVTIRSGYVDITLATPSTTAQFSASNIYSR